MGKSLTAILVLSSALWAQDAPDPLTRVKGEFEKIAKRRDLPSIRTGDRILETLRDLAGADPKVRAEACAWLKSLVTRPDKEELIFRRRVTALGLFGLLLDSRKEAEWLFGIGLRPDPAFKDLDFFVVRAFAQIGSPEAVAFLMGQLEHKSPRARLLALQSLAGLREDRFMTMVVPALDRVVHASKEGPGDQRAAAVTLLGRIPDSRVPGALGTAIADGDPLVRLAAAQALGKKLGSPGVEVLLAGLLADPVARVREETVVAFRNAPGRAVVPRLIDRLDKEPLRVRDALGKTLQGLTGMDFGSEPEPWKDWARSMKAAGRDIGTVSPRLPTPRYASRPARYYGIPILSDRLVFVLDVSGSMKIETGPERATRLAHAQQELIQVLRQLDLRSRFNVVAFSSDVDSFTRGALVEATPKNIDLAIKFILRQHPSGWTNSYGALEAAFDGAADIDTIYFLSDGSPTVGRTTVQPLILRAVQRWNRVRGVRIHTIALLMGTSLNPFITKYDDKPDATAFMHSLARETGGTAIVLQ